MEYVLIDPKMFMLQTEDAAMKNIDFFRDVISLSNSGKVSICLYKEVIDQICTREINPFPIKIGKIKNQELKEILLQLNYSFTRSIMNNYVPIDIEACEGTQDFKTNRRDLENMSEYYAFFGMLLMPCYSETMLSEKILVGESENGVSQGENVEIECSCQSQHYNKIFSWVSPRGYLSEKQKALSDFRELVKDKNLFIESPEVKKGKHHNHVQNEDFDCYEELTAKNKRVLTYLRHMGLYRIIFANFAPDTSYEYGAIKIIKVEKTDDSDIVEGWLYGCLDFRILVKLYFPKGIGNLLNKYSNGELFQKEMDELVSTLGV